jgi:hypothetical protein
MHLWLRPRCFLIALALAAALAPAVADGATTPGKGVLGVALVVDSPTTPTPGAQLLQRQPE